MGVLDQKIYSVGHRTHTQAQKSLVLSGLDPYLELDNSSV